MTKKAFRFVECTTLWSCILFCLLPACVQKPLQERLAAHEQTQAQVHDELKASTFSSKATPISWSKAEKMLLTRNLAYQNLIKGHQRTQEQRKKIWQSLIPRLFTYASINSSIDEIADISSDDINLNLTSNFSIPNPIAFYSRLYAAALSELQSQYQLELRRRQIVSTLYTYFIRTQDLEQRQDELNTLRQSLDKQELDRIASTFTRIQSTEFQLKSTQENLRTAVNEILNTPGHHWKLTGSIPNISFAKKINNLSFSTGYGRLGLKLQTLQIEGILISLWSTKVARLPSFSVGLATPQLYNNQSDDNFDFNAADYQLFSGLSKSFEFTDILDKESLRDAKFRAKVSREQLLIRLESDISRLEATKITYNRLIREKQLAEKAIRYINSSSANPSASQLKYELNQFSAAQKTLESITRQLKQLDLQLWIFDDTYWN